MGRSCNRAAEILAHSIYEESLTRAVVPQEQYHFHTTLNLNVILLLMIY